MFNLSLIPNVTSAASTLGPHPRVEQPIGDQDFYFLHDFFRPHFVDKR
jgi:hypothetical protein